jgi:decaprenylphospho-beta-D-ribofuranose 2-oxidase
MKMVPLPLSGFNQFPVQTCQVARPEQMEQLHQLLRNGVADYIPRGAGRGLGDNALNPDGVILMERLDRILSFDADAGIVRCEGGCTLEKLIETFLPRGFFPLITPGTKIVTIGGCIAADVHGKNHHHDGSFASCVIDVELLLPDGRVLRCAREENADIFWATVGGMGLTGTILSARLRLVRVESAWATVDYEQAPDLDTALRRFSENDRDYRYSVAWIDCLASGASLGRSILMRGNHAPAADVPARYRDRPLDPPRRRTRSLPFFLPGFVLSPLTVRAFNALFYRRHRTSTRIVDFERFFYPLDAISNYYRLYGRRGFAQYQAVFPHETSRTALVKMLEKLAATRSASFLAVLKTMGQGNEGLLSFPMPGHTLALDMPNTGRPLAELAAELDRIVLDHGGRIYLAKDAFLAPEALGQMYPKLPQFMQIRQRVDPQQRLCSSMARRLGLAGAA